MKKITIKPVEERTELYHHYYGQTEPQDCFIELDCRSGTVCSRHNPEIGGSVPIGVWHGHTIRFSIPILVSEAANDVMKDMAPLFERIVSGYKEVWDGNNTVAHHSPDAQDAILDAEEEVKRLVEETVCDPSSLVQVLDAWELFQHTSADDLGITADTTDDELKRMASDLEADARTEGVDVLIGAEQFVTDLRDSLLTD